MSGTISVRTHFAAGHRILGLAGEGAKCRNIHGHTFNVTWVLGQRDEIEFGELKAALRGLIKKHFDHTFILDKTDDFCNYLQYNNLKAYPLDGKPTTEAIAAEIAKLSMERLRLPWDRGREQPCSNGQLQGMSTESRRGLYPDAILHKVILDEGPENTATWTPTAYEMFPADTEMGQTIRAAMPEPEVSQ